MRAEDKMKKVRESNFELVRCILMLMVVFVHYNSSKMGNAFSYVSPGSIHYYFLCFVESLAIIGTNGFVLLAGFFGWKRDKISLRKPFGLILYVIGYKLLFYVLGLIILKEAFTVKGMIACFIPDNWFVVLYIVLVLLSPYINCMIRSLTKKSFLTLLGTMFLLFSVLPTALDVAEMRLGIVTIGLNTIAVSGASSGYSIVNFVMLYLIGAFIAKFNALPYGKRWDVLGYLACTLLIFAQEVFLGAGWSYANPLVILSTVFFVNLFRKIHITSPFINGVAKASLGVFLIHTQYLVWDRFWAVFDIQEACRGSLPGCAFNMVWCCLLTYVLCVMMDTVCRFVATPVSKRLDKISVLNKNIIEISD